MATMPEDNRFTEGWCILELMGHRRLGGYVSETTFAGAPMVRIDVPSEPPATQLYSPSSVYAITPTTEDTARALARTCRPTPVQTWELPQLTPPDSAPSSYPDPDEAESFEPAPASYPGDLGDDDPDPIVF